MTGIVLSGGLSSRMGSDKGLIEVNEETWAQHSALLLSSFDIPVRISVNDKQVEAYSNLFTRESLVIDNKALELKGPLLGIMSAHLKKPGEDLFVLACDMIGMKETVLHKLYNEYTAGDAEAYVYTVENNREPLCGIYTSSALEKVNEMLYRNQLKNFSMMNVLDIIHVQYIAVEPGFLSCFKNANAPGDLV